MKKSVTDNREMTIEEIMGLFIYRPYGDSLEMMIDSDEKIHIKGNTWIVILDHKTGDFHFSGELHKYYEIDTIESIRDCFGDIYSIFNFRYDGIERGVWITIPGLRDIVRDGPTSYELQFADEEKKRLMLERKREYYWKHKEEINARQREWYKKRYKTNL